MTDQNNQANEGQSVARTYVDPATNQVYTVDPATGKSVWVIDPATGKPMQAATPQPQAAEPATYPAAETATPAAATTATAFDTTAVGSTMQTTPAVQAQASAVTALPQTQNLSLSGLGVAALVLGILAFLISFLPLLNMGSIIMGLLGLVLGIVGMIGISKGKNRGKGIAIAGIVLSALALLITFLMYGTAAAMVDSASSSDADTTAATSSATSAAQSQAATADTAKNAEYAVTIDGARLGTDYEGKEVAIVRYTWTNNSDETRSFATTLRAQAYQNSVEIENVAFVQDLDNDGYMADVKPGGTVSFEWPYLISDHSDLTVEVSELFSFDDTLVAEQTFTLE